MNLSDIKTWTLKSIGNIPGEIIGGMLSEKDFEKKKENQTLNHDESVEKQKTKVVEKSAAFL